MNATLLCPGPSLAKYSPDKRSGWVVGVNRAAILHECDVWAATDLPLIKHTMPLGTPTLLTIDATRDSLHRRGKPWPWLVITHTGIAGETVTNKQHPWTRYTATAALQYLKWIGATRVDVYGADWSGTLDWDGASAGERRTDERWAEERAIWDSVAVDMDVVRHI